MTTGSDLTRLRLPSESCLTAMGMLDSIDEKCTRAGRLNPPYYTTATLSVIFTHACDPLLETLVAQGWPLDEKHQ